MQLAQPAPPYRLEFDPRLMEDAVLLRISGHIQELNFTWSGSGSMKSGMKKSGTNGSESFTSSGSSVSIWHMLWKGLLTTIPC